MGWRTVQISSDENLRTYLNNLLIFKDNRKIIIPFVDIDTLIIESYNATYSNKLLETLMNNNINVIVCNSKHEPFMYFVPMNGHHSSLKILEKQIQWNSIYKNTLWTKIVKNKIINQMKTLECLKLEFDKSEFWEYANNIKEMDFSNREGHAAKAYWKYLFGIDFIRDYQSNKNPQINILLNYGYTILRGMVIRSIVKKGLDPRISIFHRSYTNFFALASDIMEPFRQLVDYKVFQELFLGEINFQNNKEAVIEFLANSKVKIGDKKYELHFAIDLYVDFIREGKELEWVDLWE